MTKLAAGTDAGTGALTDTDAGAYTGTCTGAYTGAYTGDVPLILASGSPRRRDYLAMMGIPFKVVIPDVDESPRAGESPQELVARLADLKAACVAAAYPRQVVLAADTLVTLDGALLGKPHDREDACRMILRLSGRTHEVHTAVTLRRGTHIEHVRECTEVTFAPVSEQLARIYVASGESDDKSGSYALQGIASMLIERVRGSVSCVVGLPACQVRQALEKFGLFPKTVRAMP